MTAPWGPALDAELAYRHEQIRAQFGGRRRRRLHRSARAAQPTTGAPIKVSTPAPASAPAPVPASASASASVTIPRQRGRADANAAHPAAAGRPTRHAA